MAFMYCRRQDWIDNVQDPVKNENVESLVKKYSECKDNDSWALIQVWGPS